jgi:hypothetical protein
MANDLENDLQLRYTQLLEKRIAQLEACINGDSKSPEPAEDGETESKDTEFKGATKDKATETDPKKCDAGKSTSRYRNIRRKWDRDAGVHKDEDADVETLKPESKDIAYTFRRVYDPGQGEKGAHSELEIEGKELLEILRSVIDKQYPGMSGEVVSMAAPFAPLV